MTRPSAIPTTQTWRHFLEFQWHTPKCHRANWDLFSKNDHFIFKKEIAPQYFSEVPSTSVNKNTWNISVQHSSTSSRMKYHRSPPQSIFKWRYFPCGRVKVKRNSRINDGRRCQHTRWVATSASSGVTFDFPPNDCFKLFFYDGFYTSVYRLFVTCQHMHSCRVPYQVFIHSF